IVGCGIAGASLARAFAALGVRAEVYDANSAGAGASGNAAALVTPRLDAGLGPEAELFAQAFRAAVHAYEETPEAVIARGALQLERTDRDAGRFAKIQASDLFEPEALALLDAARIENRLGELAGAGLDLVQALTVEPSAVLAA